MPYHTNATAGTNLCLSQCPKSIDLILSRSRGQLLRSWVARDGVLVMGYELFSGLVGDGKSKRAAAYMDLLCKAPELVMLTPAFQPNKESLLLKDFDSSKRCLCASRFQGNLLRTAAGCAGRGAPPQKCQVQGLIIKIGLPFLSYSQFTSHLRSCPLSPRHSLSLLPVAFTGVDVAGPLPYIASCGVDRHAAPEQSRGILCHDLVCAAGAARHAPPLR